MSYLERIAECNRHDPRGFVPLLVGGERVGFVHRDHLSVLSGDGMPFDTDDDGAELVAADDFSARSAALGEAVERLSATGLLRPPMREIYPVARFARSTPLCTVDRCAVAFFGVKCTGVHMNGFVRREDGGLDIWIAERSRDKPTFPGMLDNMVAGGQPHGLGLRENLAKECHEEAGIPAQLAGRARAVGTISYVAERNRGLKPDTIFCFDLELPDEFEPICHDGEVNRFLRMPVEEVAAIVRDTQRFKFNCNLVIIDFLARHDLLDVEDPDYPAIVSGLRRPLIT